MKPELRAKILAYNKAVKEKGEKARELDILVAALLTLPPGQRKKLFSQEVLGLLSKYAPDA